MAFSQSSLPHGASIFRLYAIAFALLLAACDRSYVNPIPSTDDEAFAMASAMNEVIGLARADETGVFWTELEATDAYVVPGLGTGVAGVGRGLAAGAFELHRAGLATVETDVLDPEAYFDTVQSAASWLMAHADVASDEDPIALSWKQCIETSLERCPTELLVPATGYQRGAAGIGMFFLELYALYRDSDYSFPDPGDPEQDLYLSSAEGAARWLLSQARDGATVGRYWPELGSSTFEGVDAAGAYLPSDDPSAEEDAYTGLDRGTAGIGYFFLRLAGYSSESSAWLEQARQAGLWLVDQLEQTDGLIPMRPGDSVTSPGFYSGNAGIAYFFLALSQALKGDEATPFADAARTVFERLAATGVMQEDTLLGGVTWLTGNLPVDADPASTFTDVADGNAGIGWAFLQGSKVLGPSLRITAEQAASWLSSPEVAHYYRGLAFWPNLIEPWTDYARAPSGYPDTPGAELWSGLPAQLASVADAPGSVEFAPGLLRGGAGIGVFMLHMQEAAGDCFSALASQASRWHYYRQQDLGAERRWRWPISVLHFITAQEENGPLSAGYELGMAGVIDFLAQDRAVRTGEPASSYPLMGFLPLTQTGEGADAARPTLEEPR